MTDPGDPSLPRPAEMQASAPESSESTKSSATKQIRGLIEWVAVAVGALTVALLIKAFLLQAFFIPSGSMLETLQINDRVLVNKVSYRLHDINRGDIVVFEKPPLASGQINDLIKRVIALSGETVSLRNGDVYIDGVKLDEPYVLGKLTLPERDMIPNCDNSPEPDLCTVPPGFVFVMGDNRTGSSDSRTFGPIKESSVVGRAFLKVWPLRDLSFL